MIKKNLYEILLSDRSSWMRDNSLNVTVYRKIGHDSGPIKTNFVHLHIRPHQYNELSEF